MRKLKKGDEVVVISGKDKGGRGNILRILDEGKKAIVEGRKLAKKHVKENPQRGVKGGIVEKEMPIHISNLAIWNPTTQKADRVGFKQSEDGRKVRYFKSSGEIVDILES